MNAPGTEPPHPPERTAARCQSEILRLGGDFLALAGMPNPDPEDAQNVLNLITHAMRRWRSAHNLCHAAEHKEKAS